MAHKEKRGKHSAEKANHHLIRPQVIQLIIFRAGDEEFGIPIEAVSEIIKSGFITPIPQSPSYIRGIINVRGEIVTTIDITKRFSLTNASEQELKHIVVAKHEDILYGLMVGEVIEVLRIEASAVKPAPSMIEKIDQEFIKGVIAKDDRLIIILNLDYVLSKENFLHKKISVKKNVKHEQEKTPEKTEGII